MTRQMKIIEVNKMEQQIRTFCETLGIDTMGFMPCRRLDELVPFYRKREERNLQNEFEAKDIEMRVNPLHYMPEGKTIISIAFPYHHQEQEVLNGFSTYTKRPDYHRVVKSYLDQIKAFIETLGGKAVTFVDSNTLPERYIAYLAGVGFIGKNNMLITEKYGSYVFLGEIITDLEVNGKNQRTQAEMLAHKECGSCERCLKECPTKSINSFQCNPNICLSYLTQKKQLNEKEIKLLKGNIFGCDYCQLQCPYNLNAVSSPLEAFKILDFMEEQAEVYAGMDNAFFKEKLSGTSCGWRGKNVIKRNALIRLNYEGKEVNSFKGDSPYINAYIEKISEINRPNEGKNFVQDE